MSNMNATRIYCIMRVLGTIEGVATDHNRKVVQSKLKGEIF